MILPFIEGKSILELLIEHLLLNQKLPIIVATTKSIGDDILVEKLKKIRVQIFRGSEEDVLDRFIDAAESFGIKKIIRICADNPFLDVKSIEKLYQEAKIGQIDYIGFQVNDLPSIKTHFGFWAEYVTLDALNRVKASTHSQVYREHVTNYIYEHPNNFYIKWLPTPIYLKERNDIRLTVDTENDFNTLMVIYKALQSRQKKFSIKSIVKYLDQHSEVLQSMKNEIITNTK